jgi:PKD repeat protein
MLVSDTVTYTWHTPGPKVIEVTATNGAGWATGFYSITIDTDAALFITSSSPTWLGATTFFTATVNGSYDVLLWDFGDGTVMTDTSNLHPQHTYAAAGNYQVTATLFAGGAVAAEATTLVQVITHDDPQPARIELTTDSTSLQADGHSTARLVARVLDDSGTPLPDQVVTFATTLGHLSPGSAVTDIQGEAVVRLQAGTTAGEAIVTATTGMDQLQASVRVQFRPFELFLPIIRRS